MPGLLRKTCLILATALVLVLLFAGTGRGDRITRLEEATAPYRQDLVTWEASHLLDKWWHRTSSLLLGQGLTVQARDNAIQEFYALGTRLTVARSALNQQLTESRNQNGPSTVAVMEEIHELKVRRAELQPFVEESIEGAITQALNEAGIAGQFGWFRWPPVDFTFAPGALVLVRSPSMEIRRLDDTLLASNIDLLAQQRLEEVVESLDPSITALVVRVGGVATYPSQVSPWRSLHGTLVLATHEWMHHWLTFRPLGQRWWSGGEMTSINETLADIVGQEIGDRTLTELTGEVVAREPWRPQERQVPARSPEAFSFADYMRETRIRLDELLAQKQIIEAELWLEKRRVALLRHDVHIRKLNTAYFAFHGTYAADPRGGGVNAIEGQLRVLRTAAGDLAAFVNTISEITREGQLEKMALAAGWTP